MHISGVLYGDHVWDGVLGFFARGSMKSDARTKAMCTCANAASHSRHYLVLSSSRRTMSEVALGEI